MCEHHLRLLQQMSTNQAKRQEEEEEIIMADPRCYLNVGGKRFETTKSTLMNIPYFNNFFQRWDSGSANDSADNKPGPSVRRKEDPLFIDQDPVDFQHILKWARHPGEYKVPDKVITGFWDCGDSTVIEKQQPKNQEVKVVLPPQQVQVPTYRPPSPPKKTEAQLCKRCQEWAVSVKGCRAKHLNKNDKHKSFELRDECAFCQQHPGYIYEGFRAYLSMPATCHHVF